MKSAFKYDFIIAYLGVHPLYKSLLISIFEYK